MTKIRLDAQKHVWNQRSPRVPWEEPADLDPYIAQNLSHLPRPAHTSPWEAFTAAPLPTSRFKSTSGAVFKATLFRFFFFFPWLHFWAFISTDESAAAVTLQLCKLQSGNILLPAWCYWGHLTEVRPFEVSRKTVALARLLAPVRYWMYQKKDAESPAHSATTVPFKRPQWAETIIINQQQELLIII